MSVLKIKNENNEWVEVPFIQSSIPTADEISYDGVIVEINNVQSAIDYIHGYAIDETYVNNILDTAGYQTETQVNALISTALGKIGVAEEGAY